LAKTLDQRQTNNLNKLLRALKMVPNQVMNPNTETEWAFGGHFVLMSNDTVVLRDFVTFGSNDARLSIFDQV